ncbi:hypothetical protein D6783_00145 [Candidatus Woesearchaeota archaeon]|nr:MAG: hypothetical protein D6783_00145 [Candidatus Woesearchaeota archaeon]
MDWLVERIREALAGVEGGVDGGELLAEEGFVSRVVATRDCLPIVAAERGLRTVFVDGGEAVLFESASSCAGVLRVAVVVFLGGRRVEVKRRDVFAFVQLSEKHVYDVFFFPNVGVRVSFPLQEGGGARSSPAKVFGLARFALELFFLGRERGDVLVRDGGLRGVSEAEDAVISPLVREGMVGVAKTNSWVSKEGKAFSSVLLALQDGAWWVEDVLIPRKDGLVRVHAARLHEASSYVLRLESAGKVSQEFLELLAFLSRDPVFLGYPYPLIVADTFARVAVREKEVLRRKLMARLGRDWRKLQGLLASKDAHSVLDTMRF